MESARQLSRDYRFAGFSNVACLIHTPRTCSSLGASGVENSGSIRNWRSPRAGDTDSPPTLRKRPRPSFDNFTAGLPKQSFGLCSRLVTQESAKSERVKVSLAFGARFKWQALVPSS